MSMLSTFIREKIKSVLPDRFAVIFDGWSGGDTHYVSAFATLPGEWPKDLDSVLLASVPMGEED